MMFSVKGGGEIWLVVMTGELTIEQDSWVERSNFAGENKRFWDRTAMAMIAANKTARVGGVSFNARLRWPSWP